MPKATQYNEMFHIWFFSVLSALVGCGLVYFSSLEFMFAYPLLGLAHLIALLPAMLLSEQRWYNIVSTSVLSILFPLWGTIVGLFTMGLGAPLACSLIWGLVLMAALRRQAAFGIMLLVGAVSSLLLFVPGVSVLKHDDIAFFVSICGWYISMAFALPWIMSCKLTPPRSKFSGESICLNCGYSLIDLPQGLPCPECGQSREATRHA